METESLTPDAEETALRDMGAEADAEQGREPVEATAPPEPQTPEPKQEPPPEVEQPPEAPPETEPVTGQPQRDPVTGKFQKPETDYAKALKNQERQDRSWAKLQADKEQFRAQQAQWEEQTRMQQLEATRQQYQPLKKEGLTASEYFEGAQRFEHDGDHENALKAYKVASEMGRAEQQRYAQFQEVEAEYQWRKQLETVAQHEPKAFDPSTPIGSHLQRIVQENFEWLYKIPNGFLRAAEVAHMLTENASMKEKDDRIIELEAIVEKMQRKGQPARGGYAAPRTGEKDFDEMSLDEMEAHLKGVTAEADTWR